MTYLIDTHCHLHLMPPEGRAAAINRAQAAGVKKLVNVACHLNEMGDCLPLTDEHEFIWTTVGYHPTSLPGNIEKDLERLYEVAVNEEKVVAIGEIGLDYYHDKHPRDQQMAYLAGELNIAHMLSKPAVIHCRSGKTPGQNSTAYKDLIQVIQATNFNNAVSHCFSGNLKEAQELLHLGLYLSFTGIITYPNSPLVDVVRSTPLSRMMLETDAPYLTPQSHRGQKNEPAFLVETAQKIAEIKGISLEEVMMNTTRNAEEFFGI